MGRNLTVAGPTGAKGLQAAAIMAGAGVAPLPTRNLGPQLANRRINAIRNNLVAAKRQLSDPGRLALTTLYVASDAYRDRDAFYKQFINNIFNLTPACGACNKAKNARV
jgi:hypothetical protein